MSLFLHRNAFSYRCDQCTCWCPLWGASLSSQTQLITPFPLQHIAVCSQAKYIHCIHCIMLVFPPPNFEHPGDSWAPLSTLTHHSHVCSVGRAPTQFNMCLLSWIMSWAHILIGHMLKENWSRDFLPERFPPVVFSITEEDTASTLL